MQQYVDQERFNGAVLVAGENGVVFKQAYGMAGFDFHSWRTEVSETSQFVTSRP